MRIIVCGGRDYKDFPFVREVLMRYASEKPTIIHGGAHGADTFADRVAKEQGWVTEIHRPDYAMYGNPFAPFIRNEAMADAEADLCIAFPGGRGTRDMVRRAKRHNIPVNIFPE